jgi:hypothetical protein
MEFGGFLHGASFLLYSAKRNPAPCIHLDQFLRVFDVHDQDHNLALALSSATFHFYLLIGYFQESILLLCVIESGCNRI